MIQECQVIDSFKGLYERFSNFYPVVIHHNSFSFNSVEHAYVASKSKDPMFWKLISELPVERAGKAKRLGRKILIRKDWNMVKLSNMRRFLKQKFNYDVFKKCLLETGDVKIIEGNYWHDNYWGDCYCEKCTTIMGQNNLGKILMKVRQIIQ